jgi:hypothetical protein
MPKCWLVMPKYRGLGEVMKVDPSRFVVGDEWAYRQRDDSASERVRIVTITMKKTSARLEVAFLDDQDGRVENVPGSRLPVPWGEVTSYDAMMANWKRIDELALDRTEEACVEEVFQLLIADEIAELEWRPVSCATLVHDRARLGNLIGVPVDEILASVEWFDQGDGIVLSPAGTMRIAEAACRANPTPVLDLVMEQEAESRHKCKHGVDRTNAFTREKERTSPEWEYDWYRRCDRPRHELLRQWCGHRAVTFHGRLVAAETENHRLDVLVTDLIEALYFAGNRPLAARYAEEHERDRVTPHRARPVVDRPLDPSEIPVREVLVRHRWPR